MGVGLQCGWVMMVGRRVPPTEQAPCCRLELPGAPRGGKGRKGMGLGLRWTPEVTLELWEDSIHLLPCPRVDLGGWEGQRLGSEAGWDETTRTPVGGGAHVPSVGISTSNFQWRFICSFLTPRTLSHGRGKALERKSDQAVP